MYIYSKVYVFLSDLTVLSLFLIIEGIYYMKRRLFIFIVSSLLYLPILIGHSAHPFYVSVATIEHNEQNKILEISCRIFYDDLENELKKEGFSKDDILHPKNKASFEKGLATYLGKNFKIKVNNSPVPIRYLGYQIEEDAAWCYMEAPATGAISQISVLNTLLYQQHPSQTNIIHVTVKGKRKSTKLTLPKTTETFQF